MNIVLPWLWLALGLSLDSSGYRDTLAREWKDENGRVIKRVDRQGRMVLLTWDGEGRLVRIGWVRGRVKSSSADGTPPSGEEVWVHVFFYDEKGLSGEVDCRGVRHDFRSASPPDLRTGTALPGHLHGPLRTQSSSEKE